ncbi:hypothetical protein WJX79_007505 [Trebouxia sp. C0005]
MGQIAGSSPAAAIQMTHRKLLPGKSKATSPASAETISTGSLVLASSAISLLYKKRSCEQSIRRFHPRLSSE